MGHFFFVLLAFAEKFVGCINGDLINLETKKKLKKTRFPIDIDAFMVYTYSK